MCQGRPESRLKLTPLSVVAAHRYTVHSALVQGASERQRGPHPAVQAPQVLPQGGLVIPVAVRKELG